jgi:cyanophycin synthetase
MYGRDVLVERFIRGHDYRLLIVNGRMVAAARRDPAQVIGDGQHTVEELVQIVNRDPRRRPGHASILTRIMLDEAARLVLAQQGVTPESIPDAGMLSGVTAVDVTDVVHPKNARLAELAAQILALDVAGIDMLCLDIERPLDEQDGAVVEVNAAPGLRMHLHPAEGQPRSVGVPIVEMLYPNGAPSRIPIIAVTGTNGKTTVTRLISHIYETAHRVVGMTCTDGIYINSKIIVRGDCSGPRSAQTVLLHPQVEVAVLETARGGILREGLAFDRCTVGVVTNISRDHMGLKGVNTLEDLARVKQVVVESVSRHDGAAVLNADDPLVAEMAAATDARVVYFCLNADNHIRRAHLREGGASVCVKEGMIVLATGEEEIELIELERIPFTLGGRIRFQVQNALAAAAAAWAAGLNPALIARALTTFVTDSGMTPGRFNVTEQGGVEIVLDYGHNAAAIRGQAEAVTALGRRKTFVVMTLPGDRPDADLIATLTASLPMADVYFLHDSEDLRGRGPGEVPEMLRAYVPEHVPCYIVRDHVEAINTAWRQAHPGDRIVVTADNVEATIELLGKLARSTRDRQACDSPMHHEAASAWAGK